MVAHTQARRPGPLGATPRTGSLGSSGRGYRALERPELVLYIGAERHGEDRRAAP